MTGVNEVWGLEYALVNKADRSHIHTFRDIQGLMEALESVQPGGTNGPVYISGISGLAEALDDKAPNDHGHSIAAIANLQSALDSLQAGINEKASVAHTHSLSAIVGLQSALDEKAASDHTHPVATASAAGLMSATDKAKLDGLGGSESPEIADIQGLQDALNGKSDFTHTHAGLPSASLTPLTYTFSQSSVSSGANGSYTNLTDGNNTTGAATDAVGSISWLRADLGSNRLVSHVRLQGGTLPGFGDSSTYLKGAAIEGSLDAANWVILLPVATGVVNANPVIFAVPPTIARYIRLSRAGYIGATEFVIYGQ